MKRKYYKNDVSILNNKTCYKEASSFKVSIDINASLPLFLSLCPSAFQVLCPGEYGYHGEAVAVRDAGSCHGSAGTDLPEALRLSDSVTQLGNPLCKERSIVCTSEY